MPGLLNIFDLGDPSDDESDDESYKCDNVKNNEYWSNKGFYYAESLSEENHFDEILIMDDEIMSDLVGGYESDDSSIEVEDEVIVLVFEKFIGPKKRSVLMSAQ